MKIKHEHIRMAMNAWAYPDGEKVPAAEIARTYFELGMTFPELYDDSHPEALPVIPRKFSAGWRRIRLMRLKKFRRCYRRSKRRCRLCWWPVCAVTVLNITGRCRTTGWLVKDVDDFVAVAIAWGTLTNSGGQPGNAVVVH